jgi:hypothetical protein
LVKYVKVPVFVMSSFFDHYMLQHIMCGDDTSDIAAFGLRMQRDLVAAIELDARNAVFLDSCMHHTRCWSDVEVDGDTPASAFEAWFHLRTKRRVWSMRGTFDSVACAGFHRRHSCKIKTLHRHEVEDDKSSKV